MQARMSCQSTTTGTIPTTISPTATQNSDEKQVDNATATQIFPVCVAISNGSTSLSRKRATHATQDPHARVLFLMREQIASFSMTAPRGSSGVFPIENVDQAMPHSLAPLRNPVDNR